MSNTIESKHDFWKNKTIISFILAVIVIAIHIDTFEYYPKDGSVAAFVNDCFYSSVVWSTTQITIQLFFIITAAVFFRDYSNAAYVKKLKSRVKTLVIPYLIWNFVGTVCACILWQSHREMFFTGDIQSLVSNWLAAVFHFKCYIPFFFMFNIIVFYLAAPLIDLVMKNRFIAIAVIILLTIGQDCGITLPASVFYRSDSVIYLMIGSYIGRYCFEDFSGAVSKRKACCALSVFLVYYLIINLYSFKVVHFSVAVYCALTAVGAISFWFVCSGLICPNMKYRPIYGNSFAMYAMHFYLNYVFARGIYKLLPNPIWAIPNFIITLLATVFTIRAFCVICERLLPTVYSVIMGERKAV